MLVFNSTVGVSFLMSGYQKAFRIKLSSNCGKSYFCQNSPYEPNDLGYCIYAVVDSHLQIWQPVHLVHNVPIRHGEPKTNVTISSDTPLIASTPRQGNLSSLPDTLLHFPPIFRVLGAFVSPNVVLASI